MNKRRNYWENADNCQKILSLEQLNYSRLWSFQMMIIIRSAIWKLKLQRHINIYSCQNNMRKSPNIKLKNWKVRWRDFIWWWNRMTRLLKGRWPQFMNIQLLMNSFKKRSKFSRLAYSRIEISYNKWSKELMWMKAKSSS